MKNHLRRGVALFSLLLVFKAGAFSLMGPFTPWMDESIGYNNYWTDEIGGPMNLGEEYRWDVPVVTYGFDPSFVDYFGTNGIAAVESAIAILNNLPPASQVDITDYPLDSRRWNNRASELNLVDLKTTTLSLFLEQMGLASPLHYTFCLRDYSEGPHSTNALVIMRNFDPQTGLPSPYLNTRRLSYSILEIATNCMDAVEFPPNPLERPISIASLLEQDQWGSELGRYATNLTADDVGGLRYLLSTNNAQIEDLPPGVSLAADGSASFINRGFRPGVDRITFVPQPAESGTGGFKAATNQFTDTLIINGVAVHQALQRVTVRPDILFSAADLLTDSGYPKLFERSGTEHWANNDAINGESTLAGPGVILPPVTLTFSKLGPALLNPYLPGQNTETDAIAYSVWGWFDGSTNPPVVFPSPGTYRDVLARVHLPGAGSPTLALRLEGAVGERYQLETSPDLVSWAPVSTVTNSTWLVDFHLQPGTAEPQKFFRVVGM